MVSFSATGSGFGPAITTIRIRIHSSQKSQIGNTLRGGGNYNVVSCCCCYLASSPALSCILPTLSPVGSWKFTATVSIHELSVFLGNKINFKSRIRRRIKPCILLFFKFFLKYNCRKLCSESSNVFEGLFLQN